MRNLKRILYDHFKGDDNFIDNEFCGKFTHEVNNERFAGANVSQDMKPQWLTIENLQSLAEAYEVGTDEILEIMLQAI
jgi:hypothetical protein